MTCKMKSIGMGFIRLKNLRSVNFEIGTDNAAMMDHIAYDSIDLDICL